ncbi:DUF3017 domain-containing protein [Streptomyces xinghaiensis]|uniref:DUF3017 domain-containing protein n=1 Tax=Streptomyces xinghaiensis TaxID=1038928 RepID=UPI00031FE06D|nr:DUF3017 domain-containing protein [Streptomyces xinghaiensis]MZE77350.1 DUF3017 domain-containing protein [Streptomyces sp. SID5475]
MRAEAAVESREADGNAGTEGNHGTDGNHGTEGNTGPGRGSGPGRSRRFPRFTRSTARPEGGGRAAPGDAPAPVRQWPLLSVLGGTAVGLILVAFGVSRVGTLLIGLSLLAGAVLRWALPSVGMLAVRSRFTDMVTYGVLGALISLLALMSLPDPWLEIPWLEKIIRFAVR